MTRPLPPNGRWTLEAPAKLNLGLRVSPARPDGYHNVETWMAAISLHDTLCIEITPEIKALTLEVTGRAEGIPTDPEKNLITRAALKLAGAANIQPRARITLQKVIPPGGGLGGGSSNAAKTLLALNDAWNLNYPLEQLESLAAQLGSDIPFFIRQQPALCTGRGEIMTALARSGPPLFAVLLIPPIACPTKDVYQRFDTLPRHGPPFSPTNWHRLAQLPATEFNRWLINDLQPAAFYLAPTLATLHEKATACAAQPVHLTGSGSTLFTLCDSAPAASNLGELLTASLADQCICVPVKILA